MVSDGSRRLTKEQKTGFVLLLVFACFAIGLGVVQMRNTIYNPFAPEKKNQDQTNTTLAAILADDQVRLQTVDTDQDGINDYEELTFYHTSPYLPDTDSDGIKDKEEITAGKDPNCPEGKDCSKTQEEILTASSTAIVVSPLASGVAGVEDVLLKSGVNGASTSTQITAENIQALVNDPAALRELLVTVGKVPKEQLAGIDDATLISIARELFQQTANSPSTTSP